jgi:GNAT superfamily N-acetyltransferase
VLVIFNFQGDPVMLVRNAFPGDSLPVASKSKEWADLATEDESIYHTMIEHFRNTCFIAEDRGEIIGYLLGFRSKDDPDIAFIRLIQVAPRLRGNGVGRRLFNQYQTAVKSMGCKKIMALGEPENKCCVSFYVAMGLEASGSKVPEAEDIVAAKGRDVPGKHVVAWVKEI